MHEGMPRGAPYHFGHKDHTMTTPAFVGLDETPWFPVVSLDGDWNGFVKPVFTPETIDNIISAINGLHGLTTLEWVTYANGIRVVRENTEGDIYDYLPDKDDNYDLGAGSWAWSGLTPREGEVTFEFNGADVSETGVTYDGETVTIVRMLDPDNPADTYEASAGPMYLVRAADGTEFHAFHDELGN